MNFFTPISIPRSEWTITYDDKLLLLGSCFVDNIARKLREYYFRVTVNPTGTLYNPVSIARHIDLIAEHDVAIITFGTAWVYVDKATGEVVDNCQKRPASDFIRRRLSVEEIVELWQSVVEKYANKRFVFTVSPIRHLKDGLHENQLSKATLLLAIEKISTINCQLSTISYFPSYEILMDELRDYRFYASDMMHPSETAIDYIWERFEETYLYKDETRETMRELHQLYLDRNHRPLYPDSDDYRRFQAATEARADELRKRYPWIE